MVTKQKIALALRLLLGITFILSAYSKIISPGLVEIILIEHGIAPTREIAALFVRLLIGFELGLGVLFFQPYFLKRFVISLSGFFLIAFTVYLIYTGFILHDDQNCGCFGEMIAMSPVESIIKNLVLIGVNIWLLLLLKEEKKNFIIPTILILASVVAVFLISPIKPDEGFQFVAYTNFEGKGRVDLSSGDKLLAVFNTECEHCQATAKELTEMKKKFDWFPEMYALIFEEGNTTVDKFKEMTNSDFPYVKISSKIFFELIGSAPPRVYWLHNGLVKEKWDDNFLIRITKAFGNNL